MTAVLSPTDALRRDPIMTSLEDNYSSTDWKVKYNEVADMLAETRAELDEFHTSSKELEEELIKEIDRTEKAQQDLKVKVAKTELDRDEWKSKFISLQTMHNTTTTSLQRELDTLRQESQKLKVRLRDLELGNDDLERNERVVASSLADIEARYSKALEEKILLEHELLDKANMEEELQRVKDELRDSSVEISILKDQLIAARSRAPSIVTETSSSTTVSSLFPPPTVSSDDNLLSTPPPPDLELSDLSSNEKSSIPTPTRPPSTAASSNYGQSVLLQRAGFQLSKRNPDTSSPSSMTRSSTLPTLAASRNSPRTPVLVPRPAAVTASSSVSNITAVPMMASRSKGVQMVSEMRARVKNLEQKIHTRVPRLRMGSNAGRQGATISTMASTSTISSTLSSKSTFTRSVMPDSKLGKPTPQRLGVDTALAGGATTPNPNNSGWVLIMDDTTPSPNKDAEEEHRRSSSPSPPSAFHRGVPSSASSPIFSKPSQFGQSTMTHSRRPQSRLSGASLSTTATMSSIPTPSSRPATPTFLPIPISRPGVTGYKKSTGLGAGPYGGPPKRSSIGSSNAGSPTPSSDSEFRPRERPFSYNGKVQNDLKSLPHSNVTVRASSRIPSSASSVSILSQSKIGRPAGITGAWKSGGLGLPGQENGGFLEPDKKPRSRSGSNVLNFGRGGVS
ncbi:uncharacterized protein BJ212DRAFT_1259763 [Suillus subaureus]|uniref:NUDE domain-containing protein n=1 Tax=Suillus subaureus TaxID=48587 RepID=A0A9P7JJI4_9AGAM|nr:uncharacterized protein BJ212DRAFT_1259763 [Suillus subaureus]KAG1826062.1 hypothetical protein BJ212DRAFT_1259763 [Suillus subaureus]